MKFSSDNHLGREPLLAAMSAVQVPDFDQDLVAAGFVSAIDCRGGDVSIDIGMGFPCRTHHDTLRKQIITAVRAVPGVQNVSVSIQLLVTSRAVAPTLKPVPGIKNIIAVASGKGGVGKSTTTVNLALALAAEGAKVGILDADIYGPSIPTMLGIVGRPESLDGATIEPMMGHGLMASSIGFLIDKDEAMVWRGPMVTQALDQLLRQTNWRDLDYLLLDMPPGTGDIHLTVAQKVPVTGALIVTTPQEIALMDARKGLKMFEKVSVPVFGIVENMSTYVCPSCGHESHLFGSGGGQLMSSDYSVPLLGSLPLNISIREQADAGQPTLIADPEGPISASYRLIARRAAAAVCRLKKDVSHKFPEVVVQKI